MSNKSLPYHNMDFESVNERFAYFIWFTLLFQNSFLTDITYNSKQQLLSVCRICFDILYTTAYTVHCYFINSNLLFVHRAVMCSTYHKEDYISLTLLSYYVHSG